MHAMETRCRRGGVASSLCVRVAEQVELAHEVPVEDAHLTVENERRRRKLRDPADELGEAGGVVDGVAAEEPDAAAVL